MYVTDSIKLIRLNDALNSNLELLCAEVQLHKGERFLLSAWYSPSNDPITIFHRVEVVLSYLVREGKELILIGNTNRDLSGQSLNRKPSK